MLTTTTTGQMNFLLKSGDIPVKTDDHNESMCDSFVPTRKQTGTCSSCGIVHVLRCNECGFETILRDRFDVHSPCAGKLESYLLYTCSLCGTCSTSQKLMQEHVELCHAEQALGIEESKEFFKPSVKAFDWEFGKCVLTTSTQMSPSPQIGCTLRSRPPSKSPLLNKHDLHENHSGDSSHTQQSSETTKSTRGLDSVPCNDNCWNPFTEFINQFGSTGKQFVKDTGLIVNQSPVTSNAETPTNEFVCPVCYHYTTPSLDEVIRHLALLHLLPFPSIMSCLSSQLLMASQKNIPQRSQRTANKNSSAEKTLSSSSYCPTSCSLTSALPPPTDTPVSHSIEQNLKRDHSPVVSRQTKNQRKLSGTASSPFESKSDTYTNLMCPQCATSQPSIYHLQLHFMQQHAADFGNMFNLHTAIAMERMPFPLPTQSLSSLAPTSLLSVARADSHVATRTEAIAMHERVQTKLASLTQTLDSARPELHVAPLLNPFNTTSNWMNLQLATAAAALGFPIQTELANSRRGSTKSVYEDVASSGESQAIDFRQHDICSPTYLEHKRPRLQSIADIANEDIQGPLTNGNTLTSNPYSWLTGSSNPSGGSDKQASPGNSSKYLPSMLSDVNYSSLFREQLPLIPQSPTASFSLPDPLNLIPLSTGPTQTAANHMHTKGKRQMEQSTLNGTAPNNLSTNAGHFVWPNTCHLLKLDMLHNENTVEAQQPDLRCREASKRTVGAIVATKSITETASISAGNETQTNAPNGIVHNTLRKTRSDMKVIHRYLVQVKHDNRDIHQIPYYELDQYIQDFVLTAKKKDGHEYEPESLKAFVHSLERHLKHHDYPHSVLKGNAFTGTRAVLNQRLNELRALSRSGNSSGGTCLSTVSGTKRLTETSGSGSGDQTVPGVQKRLSIGKSFTSAGLVQAGLLGNSSPQAILNSLWLINRTQFNIGGTQRHRNLVWGQFQLVTDELGVKAIKFTPLFESAEVRYCRGFGGSKVCETDMASRSNTSLQVLSCTGTAKRQPLPFNCVELFELYATLRPTEARGVSEPFYLSPETVWAESGTWFKTNAAGSQLLSRIPRLLGLKPARESMPSRLASNNQQYRDAAESNGVSRVGSKDRIGQSNLHDSTIGSAVFEDQQSSLSQHTWGPNFPLPCSLLGTHILNYLPFIFPPNPDSLQSTTVQYPYLVSQNTFSNYPLNNSSTLFTQKSETCCQRPGQLKTPEMTEDQHEANNLIIPGVCTYRKSDDNLRSPLTHSHSPSLKLERFPAVPSSDGTQSPTDAEHISLNDASPKALCPILDIMHAAKPYAISSQVIGRHENGSTQNEISCSPQNSSASHSSSRPQSAASRHSLVESSGHLPKITDCANNPISLSEQESIRN